MWFRNCLQGIKYFGGESQLSKPYFWGWVLCSSLLGHSGGLHALSRYGAATFTRTWKTAIHGRFPQVSKWTTTTSYFYSRSCCQSHLGNMPSQWLWKFISPGETLELHWKHYLQLLLLKGKLCSFLPGQVKSKSGEVKWWKSEAFQEKKETDGVLGVPQTSMKCNILPEKEDSPFALEVKTLPQICEGPKVHASFQISLNVR